MFMKTIVCASAVGLAAVLAIPAQEPSLESAPPVVVKTVPPAGSTTVDPGLTEIRVTFSKPMQEGSWSWCMWSEESMPEIAGKIHYLSDGRTCLAPVKLQPGKFYAAWLNSGRFQNFRDTNGQPAVPYLLSFQTAQKESAETEPGTEAAVAPGPGGSGPQAESPGALNERQQSVLDWTDRQFRGFFDRRTFDGWSEKERSDLETRLLDTLKGPQTREYYHAINTLAALRSKQAVPLLLAIATDRAEKDCRDRWMAIRALGIIGDKSVVPELIPLLYHGNINTRWWAQISLVRLTGRNFGTDWQAWGDWWNGQGSRPPFETSFVVWYHDPAWSDPAKLPKTLADADEKFFAELKK
jgi:HEAT repeats/Bacterial Ig-like domain